MAISAPHRLLSGCFCRASPVGTDGVGKNSTLNICIGWGYLECKIGLNNRTVTPRLMFITRAWTFLGTKDS